MSRQCWSMKASLIDLFNLISINVFKNMHLNCLDLKESFFLSSLFKCESFQVFHACKKADRLWGHNGFAK